MARGTPSPGPVKKQSVKLPQIDSAAGEEPGKADEGEEKSQESAPSKSRGKRGDRSNDLAGLGAWTHLFPPTQQFTNAEGQGYSLSHLRFRSRIALLFCEHSLMALEFVRRLSHEYVLARRFTYPELEVVYVPCDVDEAGFAGLLKHMPWVAILAGDTTVARLAQKFVEKPGVPKVVILDRDGHIHCSMQGVLDIKLFSDALCAHPQKGGVSLCLRVRHYSESELEKERSHANLGQFLADPEEEDSKVNRPRTGFVRSHSNNTPSTVPRSVVWVGSNSECMSVDPHTWRARDTYCFDQCFWSLPDSALKSSVPYCDQALLYHRTGRLMAEDAMFGNQAIFYSVGSEASARAHTLGGGNHAPKSWGIVIRVAEEILFRINRMRQENQEVEVHDASVDFSAVMIEPVDSTVTDLLTNRPGLSIRTNFENRAQPYVESASWRNITNPRNVISCLEAAEKNRATGTSGGNNGHNLVVVYQIKVAFRRFDLTESLLSFVDIPMEAPPDERSARTGRAPANGTGGMSFPAPNTLRIALDCLMSASRKQPPHKDSALLQLLWDNMSASRNIVVAQVSPARTGYLANTATLRMWSREMKAPLIPRIAAFEGAHFKLMVRMQTELQELISVKQWKETSFPLDIPLPDGVEEQLGELYTPDTIRLLHVLFLKYSGTEFEPNDGQTTTGASQLALTFPGSIFDTKTARSPDRISTSELVALFEDLCTTAGVVEEDIYTWTRKCIKEVGIKERTVTLPQLADLLHTPEAIQKFVRGTEGQDATTMDYEEFAVCVNNCLRSLLSIPLANSAAGRYLFTCTQVCRVAIAALEGDEEEVHNLASEAGFSINDRGRKGESALHIVSEFDSSARLVLKQGASNATVNDMGYTPLDMLCNGGKALEDGFRRVVYRMASHAIQAGETDILMRVGRSAPHVFDFDDFNLLMCAVVADRLEVVDFLLEKGVDVNAQDRAGVTALQYARALYKPDNPIFQTLFTHNSQFSVADKAAEERLQQVLKDHPAVEELISGSFRTEEYAGYHYELGPHERTPRRWETFADHSDMELGIDVKAEPGQGGLAFTKKDWQPHQGSPSNFTDFFQGLPSRLVSASPAGGHESDLQEAKAVVHQIWVDARIFTLRRVLEGTHDLDPRSVFCLFCFASSGLIHRYCTAALRSSAEVSYWGIFLHWLNKGIKSLPQASKHDQGGTGGGMAGDGGDNRVVYRLVHVPFDTTGYSLGKTPTWLSFSCGVIAQTRDRERDRLKDGRERDPVIRNWMGSSTALLFIITGGNPRSLAPFSCYGERDRVVFPLNTRLRITRVLRPRREKALPTSGDRLALMLKQAVPVEQARCGEGLLAVEMSEGSVDAKLNKTVVRNHQPPPQPRR